VHKDQKLANVWQGGQCLNNNYLDENITLSSLLLETKWMRNETACVCCRRRHDFWLAQGVELKEPGCSLASYPGGHTYVCVCLFVRASTRFGYGSLLVGTFWQSLVYVTIKSTHVCVGTSSHFGNGRSIASFRWRSLNLMAMLKSAKKAYL